ncbi:hypothetical protein C823_000090 [Eubacterium plexicaudatum ASF492]|nr:hypothetical protein C823_000090 [Eubacterium plexicaudatum ASF492]
MQHEISNGMLKTIYYIVELITMSENSLVLIDKFENGLGVNCIDVLAEILLSERNDLQFVITSHHPKIINQISNKKWKIIERDIAVVRNMNAEEYGRIMIGECRSWERFFKHASGRKIHDCFKWEI